MCESSRTNNEKLINDLFTTQKIADDEKNPAQNTEVFPTTDKTNSSEPSKDSSRTDEPISDFNVANEIPPCAGLDDESHGSQEESRAKEEEESKDDFVLAEIDEEEMKLREESMSPLELDEKAIKAQEIKEEANALYTKSDVDRALELYTEALTICPVARRKERAALYGNRSACCFQLEQHKMVVRECTKALEFEPNYVKVLKRRAKSHEKLDQLEQALEDYKRVSTLDPSDSVARERLFNLPREIEERNEKLKAEMMGKLKDLGNMFLKPFGLSTNNFKINQDPNSGGYNIQFDQNPGSS